MSSGAICRYWATKGECFFGDKCKFRHPPGAAGAGEAAAAAAAAAAPAPAGQGRGPDHADPLYPEEMAQAVRAAPFVPAASPSGAAAAPGGLGRGGRAGPEPSPKPRYREGGPDAGVPLPVERPVDSFFMPADLRARLLHRMSVIVARLSPEDQAFYGVPLAVCEQRLHSLWPLPYDQQGGPAAVYKATYTVDGAACAVRRMKNVRLPHDAVEAALAPWMRLPPHPGIVPVREFFASAEFGDGGSLCFVCDFFPGAATLRAQHLAGQGAVPAREDTLWSYACQLVAALTAVHRAGLASRAIVPSRVLVTGHNRVRLSWPGLPDALGEPTTAQTLAEAQRMDLGDLGHLLLALAGGAKSPSDLADRYSPDMRGLVAFLLAPPGAKQPTVFSVAQLVAHRMVDEVSRALTHGDALERHLALASQNGRLFSLVAKLDVVSERPEQSKYGETEKQYILKLFRDLVFHAADEGGDPDVDFASIVMHLNKLDVGSAEKVVLSSRDGDSILLVSYEDLRAAIEESFTALTKKKRGGAAGGQEVPYM